jgi:prepilin-type N-terminal cleavage/methylation domain-containing protein
MNCVRELKSDRMVARRKRGFSLIEVLVAMTILSVIVLIVAGVFQQTGLAWSMGLRRADAQSMVRAVAGAVARDLSMIVDPTNFIMGTDADSIPPGDPLSVKAIGGGSLDFYILKPTDDVTSKHDVARELTHITYSGGAKVERKEAAMLAGGGEREIGKTTFDLGAGADRSGSVKFDALTSGEYEDNASLYNAYGVKITIKPATPMTINDYEIAIGSCGPDGKWGTEDDIRSWVEGEDNK